MSLRGDPTHDSEQPAQGRVYVPEGPMWDAWNAPDGGAVKLSIKATKIQARWLRRGWPQPFGLAPGSAHPTPERIGEAYGAGTLCSGVATMLGLRASVHTMSIRYGDAAGPPSAPTAEITPEILALHMGPQFPDIVRLRPADVDPMLSAMENPDKELIAAALAEMRRQHIEQMRNQTHRN